MTHEQETENFLGHLVVNDRDDAETKCYECDSEGWIVGVCFEDCCCCADPESEHGFIPCPSCS